MRFSSPGSQVRDFSCSSLEHACGASERSSGLFMHCRTLSEKLRALSSPAVTITTCSFCAQIVFMSSCLFSTCWRRTCQQDSNCAMLASIAVLIACHSFSGLTRTNSSADSTCLICCSKLILCSSAFSHCLSNCYLTSLHVSSLMGSSVCC